MTTLGTVGSGLDVESIVRALVDAEIAPKVMELEDTQIELKGSAQEQYATWRSALRRVYEQEQVPDVAL